MGTNPRDNDLMLITKQQGNWNIKRVIIDPWSSVDVLFWDEFHKLQLDSNKVKVFRGSLMGLLGEHVQVKDHVTQETTYGEGGDANAIEVICLIVDVISPTKSF